MKPGMAVWMGAAAFDEAEDAPPLPLAEAAELADEALDEREDADDLALLMAEEALLSRELTAELALEAWEPTLDATPWRLLALLNA